MPWWGYFLVACAILGAWWQLHIQARQGPHLRSRKRYPRWYVSAGRRVGPVWLGVFRRFR